jgi:type II secretory pathway component PulM
VTSLGSNLTRLWRDRTGRHVTIVVAAKVCLLAAIWWAFVRESQPEPDPSEVAAAVLHAAPRAATATPESTR